MAKVKICGLTRLEDAKLAFELGAYALGFNFYEKSPRNISAQDAQFIARQLPASVKIVGVFVNMPKEDVEYIARKVPLDTLQFHGDETEDYISSFKSWDVIKAIRLTSDFNLENLNSLKAASDYLLFDSFTKEFGGSGKEIPNDLLAQIKEEIKHSFLAGGITPENAQEKIELYDPMVLDVASGVEEKPGIKSAEKLKKLFQNIEKN